MGMEMKLNLKLAHKLVMTPMLQQAIKLLPLARLELAQHVQQQIIDNPVLEEILEDEEETEIVDEDEDFQDGASTENETNSEEELENSKEVEFDEDSISQSIAESELNNTSSITQQEVEWDNYFQDNIDRGSSAGDYLEKPSIEATYKVDPTLNDHLLWQLNLTVDSEKDKVIGTCIVWNIRKDGYLDMEPAEIAELAGANEEEVLNVLKIIQNFEPLGCGARCLQECLTIQARALPDPDPLVLALIDSYLDRLEDRNFPKIAAELKTEPEEIARALEKIREFDPKPGLSLSSEGIDYVIPDVIVVKTEAGYDIVLNEEGVPKVRLNSYYEDLLKNTSETQTKEFLDEKHRSAVWLIKSIDQRRQTIFKVGKSIIKQQEEFLDHGLSFLKPMVLRDVALDIEMHESTVSRITTNKYIDTPQGIFELKFFFHSGIKSYIGNNMSSIRVKSMIKDLIGEENPEKPYTDDEMVQVLMRKNAKIARRTITKYRKELNIPPASKRKKLY